MEHPLHKFDAHIESTYPSSPQTVEMIEILIKNYSLYSPRGKMIELELILFPTPSPMGRIMNNWNKIGKGKRESPLKKKRKRKFSL